MRVVALIFLLLFIGGGLIDGEAIMWAVFWLRAEVGAWVVGPIVLVVAGAGMIVGYGLRGPPDDGHPV